MPDVRIAVTPEGTVRFIYRDDLRPLLKQGQARIERASHVEPKGTMWEADLTPVSGPVLGPFTTRQAALDAEVEWLDAHLGVLHGREGRGPEEEEVRR